MGPSATAPSRWEAVFAACAFALFLVGVVFVYSASFASLVAQGEPAHAEAVKQAAIGFAGIAIAVVLWAGSPDFLCHERIIRIFWVFVMLLLVATSVFGVSEGGACRWLPLGPVSFQPSELAKISVTMASAGIVQKWRAGTISGAKAALRSALYAMAPAGYVCVAQSDMGTALICIVGAFAAAFYGGVPKRYLALCVAACVLLGIAGVNLAGYRASRISEFLSSILGDGDSSGMGYQGTRATYAFASGGFFGVGLGNSKEKFMYLPEADTDYIFAVIGEEAGLLGCMAVILLFFALLHAGLRIARDIARLETRVAATVAASLPTVIIFQAYLNIGCVIGLIPPTGKPLPFISYGGSSLLVTLLMVGIVLGVSRNSRINAERKARLQRRKFRVSTRYTLGQ